MNVDICVLKQVMSALQTKLMHVMEEMSHVCKKKKAPMMQIQKNCNLTDLSECSDFEFEVKSL